MTHAAVLVIMAAGLLGCSAAPEDAGGASAGSQTTNVIPTDQPAATDGGAVTTTPEPAPKDNPLDGLEPCDLISEDEAVQLELADARPRGDAACLWRYTGESDDTVYAVIGFQYEGSGMDDLIELGNAPVPGKLGNHEAAVGIFEEGEGLACRVAVVVGESAGVNIGTVSKGFSGPSDPLCGDFSNQLARQIEPKLPVADASASASATESSEDGPLAQLQPCDLISDDEAAQLGLTNEAGNEQGGEARQCAWLYEGDGPGDRLGVILSIESAGIGGIVGDNITPVPSIGTHDAMTFTSAINAPAVAIGVDDSSRVDVQVSALQLGESPDPSKAGQVAMDVATVVEPNLP